MEPLAGWPWRGRAVSWEGGKKSKLVMLYYFFLWQCSEVCKCQHVNLLSLSDIIASFQKCVSCIFSSILQAFSTAKFL